MIKKLITLEGFKKFQEILEKLKNTERTRIIKEIKKAREFGDLKENAEYHSAKNEQNLIEKKIKEFEEKISNFEVIDTKIIQDTNIIKFGAIIELMELKTQKISIYQIVGEEEADIKNNKVSYKSPLSKILLNKSLNQIIDLITPNGIFKYQIKSIKYI